MTNKQKTTLVLAISLILLAAITFQNLYNTLKPKQVLSLTESIDLFSESEKNNWDKEDLIGYQKLKEEHPIIFKEEEEEEEEDKFHPGYFEELNELIRDPNTGTIPIHRLMEAKAIANRKRASRTQLREIPLNWEERGPDNIGGRSRAVLVDASDPTGETVWAGSTSGGLWKTTNISSPTPGWQIVDDFFSQLGISGILQDPTDLDIMYFGSGETWGNGGRGLGIWRSLDGGNTWNQLASTAVTDISDRNSFSEIYRMTINDQGHLFVCAGQTPVRKSTDRGETWQNVLPLNNTKGTDIEIASDGSIYVFVVGGFNGIYKSTDDGANWTKLTVPFTSSFRGEIATSFSDPNRIYVYTCAQKTLYRSEDGGNTWITTANSPDINQCGWDVTIGVRTNDPDYVILGGTPIYLSKDGGETWGFGQDIHVDHHVIQFDPNRDPWVINANDGGIYAGDLQEIDENNFTIPNRNKGYNTVQFYTAAIDPRPGNNIMLGGTQDNGTQLFRSPGINATTFYQGGDGAFCAIDENEPNIWISSFQNGVYSVSNNGGVNRRGIGSFGGGFIAAADYDDQLNIMYTPNNQNGYTRVSDVGTTNLVENKAISKRGSIRAVKVSPTVVGRVYFGTTGGQVIRVSNAQTARPKFDIIRDVEPFLNISSIDIDRNDEDHIIITFFNYGATSILETKDGGATWVDLEGDLPDLPVYWGTFAPGNSDQIILGTEIGVWTTENVNGDQTVWEPSVQGLANTRVTQIHHRKSDNTLIASSYGRGMFTTDFYSSLPANGDVSLSLFNFNPAAAPNEPFDVRLTVKNEGYTNASNLEAALPIPPEFVYNSHGPSQGNYNPVDEGIWTIGNLLPGQEATLIINIQYLPVENASLFAQLTNMTEPDGDSSPNNNTGSTAIEDDETLLSVVGEGLDIDVELKVSASQEFYNIEDEITVSVELFNLSQVAVSNLTVEALLPNRLDFISAGPNYDPESGIIQFGTLEARTNVRFDILAKVNDTAFDDFSFFAQVETMDEEDADSAPGNNEGIIPLEDDEDAVLFKLDPSNTCSGILVLETQAEVNAFADCPIFIGNITVQGEGITSIQALSVLEKVTGSLNIVNTNLTNLDGLENLTKVGNQLTIAINPELQNINALSNLREIGGFFAFVDNDELLNINGFNNLESIGTGVYYQGNLKVKNLDALSGLSFLGGSGIELFSTGLENVDGLSGLTRLDRILFIDNDFLQDIDGLINVTGFDELLVLSANDVLTNIQGLGNVTEVLDQGIFIGNHPLLTSLDGLENLERVGSFFTVSNNLTLTDCCAIYDFLNEFDFTDIDLLIEDNPSECSTTTEILETCIPGEDIDLELSLNVDPAQLPIYNYFNAIVTVQNTGSTTATNVIVRVPTIDGIAYDNQTISQGTYFYFGEGDWFVGSLGAGQSATLSLRLFTLTENERTAYAQVINADQNDLDSSPNNNPGPIPTEDDEAAATVNGDVVEECTLTNANFRVSCDNAGTPNDPSDDTYKLFLNPSGSNLGNCYNVSGEVSATCVPYGSSQQINGDFLISNGNLNITITDQSGNCELANITITAPAPCSGGGDLADLQINNLQSSGSGLPGDEVGYSFDLINGGQVIASGNYSIGAFLSTDSQLNSSDIRVGFVNTGNTPVGTIQGVQGAITIPNNISPGSYFLIIVADEGSEITESNENNNTANTPFTVRDDGGGGCESTSNIALNKTTQQSSTLVASGITGSPDKAVDGNTNGVFFTNNSSVSATTNSTQPWWQVDLGDDATIESIKVFNRTDGTDKANDFYVLVSDTPFGTASLTQARSQASFEDFTSGLAGRPTTINFDGSGRYVRVQMNGGGYLTLAEVEVIGCFETIDECNISAFINNKDCQENGVSFDLTVNGTNTSNAWTASIPNGNSGTISVTGSYGQRETINLSYRPVDPIDISIRDNNDATCTTTLRTSCPPIIGEGADLSLSISVDNDKYVQYENYFYTYTVTNEGDENMVNISVQVPQPEGMAFTSSSAEQGEYFPWGEFLWAVGELGIGESVSLEVIWFTLVASGEIVTYAQVFSASPNDVDSTPQNGTCCTATEDDEAALIINPVSASARSLDGKITTNLRNPRKLQIHQVFPNPAKEKVQVKVLSSMEEVIKVEVYDIKGKQWFITNFEVIPGPNTLQLQTNELPSGLYHAMLFTSKGKAEVAKFLIQE